MDSFSSIKTLWKNLIAEADSGDTREEPVSLRVLDFDHTVAFTGELVYVMSPEGEITDKLDSKEYATHSFSENEVLAGYTYDFSEFDDVDETRAVKNDHVTDILSKFVNADTLEERIILILTARNQDSEPGIRRFLETISIPHDNIVVIGVGSSSPQKKVDEVERILDKYQTINRVSFFDDSSANAEEMVNFLKKYGEVTGRKISYDVAKVEEDGKLTRPPGYRERK